MKQRQAQKPAMAVTVYVGCDVTLVFNRTVIKLRPAEAQLLGRWIERYGAACGKGLRVMAKHAAKHLAHAKVQVR